MISYNSQNSTAFCIMGIAQMAMHVTRVIVIQLKPPLWTVEIGANVLAPILDILLMFLDQHVHATQKMETADMMEIFWTI